MGFGGGGGGLHGRVDYPCTPYFDFVPQIKPTKFSQPLDDGCLNYNLVSDDFETFIQN